MQTRTLVSAFVMVAVALMTVPQTADAECCMGYTQPNVAQVPARKICGDCSHPTPYCARRGCNIFGCNCAGGCRRGACSRHGKRSVGDERIESAEELVSAGDLNGDGVLSFEEAESILQLGEAPSTMHRRSVRSLDKNMDGLLSADEIDY